MRRLADFYGGQPLHLLATIASFAIVAAGFVGWATPGSDLRGVLLWLFGCLIVGDLVLLPSAWLLDRLAFGHTKRGDRVQPAGAGAAYIRVPAMLSILLLLVFAPLIFRADSTTFHDYTGMTTSQYGYRWLLTTAALFGVSAVAFAARLARARRRAHL